MASPNSSLRLVCVNCKLRKKKCDKAQPRCGYCSRKKLNCQYKSPDNKHLLVEPDLSLAAAPSPVIRSSLLLSNSLSEVLRSRPTTTDSTLYLQALRIIRAAGQFVDDISARYFRGIHDFIPVVSHRRVHDHLVNFGAPPPASFSILLLSMCLITYHPEFASKISNPLDQQTLYLATKALWTQVQSSNPPSLDLIQAGIIIATYEYSNVKINDAFASIGICARMGYAARLHLANPDHEMDAETYRKAEEEANTWWGIIVCERTFFCEMDDDFRQPFSTRMPGNDDKLPKKSQWPIKNTDAPFKLPRSDTDGVATSSSGGFACIAQAAWLLDQVFKTLDVMDINTRYNRLNGLDHTLRTTLVAIMDQADGRWGMYCTANAIIVRALFILHFHILDHIQEMGQTICKSPHDWVKSSHAALNTITKMVEDVTYAQNGMHLTLIDTLTPSCSFNIRVSLRHIRESGVKSDEWEGAETQLEKALQRFVQRWGVST